MDQLANLIDGFGQILTLQNLLWVTIGAFLGTAIGVLPGLGSAMAVGLLLPLTFTLEPLSALTMFAGIYFGGLFGDSIAGILMNTPGNSTAIASAFEGHMMAKKGRAAQALATAAIGAFIGGIIATTLVVFFAPSMASLAEQFGPAEYFALALFAFVAISTVVADSVVRGLAALSIGLALAMVGIDQSTGTARFTFGIPALFDGISVVVITVALLAIGLFAATTTFDNPARTLSLATASAVLLLTATTLGRGPVGPVAGHLVVTTGAAGTAFALAMYAFLYGPARVFGALPGGPLALCALGGLAAGVALSVVAAIYPARVAAAMGPAHALRSNV